MKVECRQRFQDFLIIAEAMAPVLFGFASLVRRLPGARSFFFGICSLDVEPCPPIRQVFLRLLFFEMLRSTELLIGLRNSDCSRVAIEHSPVR